ncbi:MAG: hypothetical protein ACXW4O_09345, partial [Candidatus Binatia bacterium]
MLFGRSKSCHGRLHNSPDIKPSIRGGPGREARSLCPTAGFEALTDDDYGQYSEQIIEHLQRLFRFEKVEWHFAHR